MNSAKSRPYLLIVDDNADWRGLSVLSVGNIKGYAVETARDGAEAMRLIAEIGTPALVITDLKMPVMDGAQLVMAMRADPVLSNVPIIVLSAEPTWPPEIVLDRVTWRASRSQGRNLLKKYTGPLASLIPTHRRIHHASRNKCLISRKRLIQAVEGPMPD